MSMYILLDIDHTIANSFWRDSMIGVQPWDDYHTASKDDKAFKKVVTLINSLSSMNYVIIAFTGRNEKFRALTLDWFLKHKIDVDELLMRPDDNFEKNGVMKSNLLHQRFNGNFKNIQFAIDDNEDSCLELYKLGITTLQIRNINGAKNANGKE
jgi:uncharacterized HAD superfamily protein